MRAVHFIHVSARTTIKHSPVPIDTYQVTVEANHEIPIATLIEAQGWFAEREISQEALTIELASRLQARVTTLGRRLGVKSEVSAG